MIVRKDWQKVIVAGIKTYYYRGWFLFGIIPLYIIRTT